MCRQYWYLASKNSNDSRISDYRTRIDERQRDRPPVSERDPIGYPILVLVQPYTHAIQRRRVRRAAFRSLDKSQAWETPVVALCANWRYILV
jgi:hypothetical protein